jgi:hypothetical protein
VLTLVDETKIVFRLRRLPAALIQPLSTLASESLDGSLTSPADSPSTWDTEGTTQAGTNRLCVREFPRFTSPLSRKHDRDRDSHGLGPVLYPR